MTGPIPIQAPHIDPGIFQRMGGEEGLAPLIQALEFAKTAGQAQQRIDAENQQRQQQAALQAQQAQDLADGTKAFYDHLSGATGRAAKPGPNGEPPATGVDPQGFLAPLPQIERGLSPGAHAAYMQLIQQHNAGVQQQQEGAQREVQTTHDRIATALALTQQQAADKKAADDTATRGILAKYGPTIQTEAGARKAIGEVLTQVGPEQAQAVANALNVGTGRYGHVVGPDGNLYITDSKTGTVRKDVSVGSAGGTLGAERMQAIQRSAGTIVDLLDAQQQIIGKAGVEGSKNPAVAGLLQDSKFLGLNTGALANLFRTDPEQATQMLRTRFAHNYIGMLANARSSGQLLQNLTESYWPPPGSSAETLRRAEQDRQRLRNIMVGVRDGKITDLNKIPGFTASASAAAAEGQAAPVGGQQPTANPDDFAHGPPQ